jgi:hypothetical protein
MFTDEILNEISQILIKEVPTSHLDSLNIALTIWNRLEDLDVVKNFIERVSEDG